MGEDPDILRMVVATDNHLGYHDRDPVRGMDSFAAFEEILLIAKKKKVDFVLLGGDLFHDNKPSRRTMYRAMDILRKHCFGADPVSFKIISDQAANFKNRYGCVNYEDENYSVGLPVFSIHGNHDDPTREGGVEALAALDLLSVANLVNYFGKSDKVDDVEVMPILIKKGATKVALYGLGSMRDERLNRMWNQKKVKFLRPSEEDGRDSFFNIFVLHQNRDLGRGKKNCVHESMIPEWMDLVVWGHEHECQIDPVDSLVGTFRVTQPGSSVATSLVEGEAVPKRVGLLEIRLDQFRLTAEPLAMVRPFRVGEVCLGEVEGLDPNDPKVDELVGKVLAGRVEALLAELAAEGALAEPRPRRGQHFRVEHREQALVRLKVEHTGFPSLNNQRFGSQFVGRVANPADLLLFHRRRPAQEPKTEGGDGSSVAGGPPAGLAVPLDPAELDAPKVEDLVRETLAAGARRLALLDERALHLALENYVYKEDIRAIQEAVEVTLEKTQRRLKKDKTTGASKDHIQEALQQRASNGKYAEDQKTKKSNETSTADLEEDDYGGGMVSTEEKKKRTGEDGSIEARVSNHRAGGGQQRGQTNSHNRGESFVDLDDEEEDFPPSKKKRAATKTGLVDLADEESGPSDGDSGRRPEKKMPTSSRPQRRSRAAAQKKITSYATLGESDEEEVEEAFGEEEGGGGGGGRRRGQGGGGGRGRRGGGAAPPPPPPRLGSDDDEDQNEFIIEDSEEEFAAPTRQPKKSAANNKKGKTKAKPVAQEKQKPSYVPSKSAKSSRGDYSNDVNGQAKKRRRLPQWSQASQPPMGDGDDGEAGASSSLRQSSLFQAWGSGNS